MTNFQLDTKYRWFKIHLPKGKWIKEERRFEYGDFYFRGMTAEELFMAGRKKEELEAQDYALKRCVIPADLDISNWQAGKFHVPPGTTQRLIDEIYVVSGLSEAGIPQEEAFAWISSEKGAQEAIAVSLIASLDLRKLRTACPFDYWKYIVDGESLFQILYGRSSQGQPQQGTGPIENGIIPPDPLVIPPHGQVGRQNLGGFSWKKGR